MWYIVQPGDCLNMIALRFGVCIRHLLQLNPMAYYTLYVGQRLFIPLPHSRTLVSYTVVTGDTLDSIAQNFNTTKQLIKQLNYLSSDYIVPGQKLKIDTGSRIPSPGSIPIKNYVVKVDDTLDSIAQKFNVTKHSIMLLNKLSRDFIVPDQVLKIETCSDIPYSNYRPLATYKVQVGDTLETIARKFNTTKEALIKLNGLISEVLKAGDTLTVEVK